MEQMIRRIIRAAVESFPINRTKKSGDSAEAY